MTNYIEDIATILDNMRQRAETIENQLEKAARTLDNFDSLFSKYQGVGISVKLEPHLYDSNYFWITTNNARIGYVYLTPDYASGFVNVYVNIDRQIHNLGIISQEEIAQKLINKFDELCLKITN